MTPSLDGQRVAFKINQFDSVFRFAVHFANMRSGGSDPVVVFLPVPASRIAFGPLSG